MLALRMSAGAGRTDMSVSAASEVVARHMSAGFERVDM